MHELTPHYAPLATLPDQMAQQAFSVLDAASVAQWAACSLDELNALSADWNDMPHDQHLKDGGRYRRRRHSSFVHESGTLAQVPHRAHWQSLDYNALHGGMARWFEPILDITLHQPAWPKLLSALATTANQLRGMDTRWCIEAHQFRIDTTDGIGRPTPEGAHRDGVDFVAVFVVHRQSIKGGETRVFDAHGPRGERFTMTQAWSLLLLDDARVIHESTPVQPLGAQGHRDTLVVTLRANHFQDPAS